MKNHKTFIYLVTNCFGDSNKVYIGKTRNITSRKADHKRKLGNQIEFSVIDEVNSLDRKLWKSLETYWIEQFRQWNFELINVRKEGGSGPEYQTEETKLRISKSNSKPRRSTIKMKKPKPQGFGLKVSLKTKGKPKLISRTQEHKNKLKISCAKNCSPIKQLDLNENFIKEWPSIKEASDNLKINPRAIIGCLNNRTKTSGNYKWRYK